MKLAQILFLLGWSMLVYLLIKSFIKDIVNPISSLKYYFYDSDFTGLLISEKIKGIGAILIKDPLL